MLGSTPLRERVASSLAATVLVRVWVGMGLVHIQVPSVTLVVGRPRLRRSLVPSIALAMFCIVHARRGARV